jgi:hypothetical protein
VPPRYAYWTILIDNAPTAFRARDREELEPTLTQLRRTNKNVALRWFARGRLWDSPEQAQWAAKNATPERRGADWRPGGTHQDPRARFDKRHPKAPKSDRAARPASPSWRDKAPRPRGAADKRPWSSGGNRPASGSRPPAGGERRGGYGNRPSAGGDHRSGHSNAPRSGGSRPGAFSNRPPSADKRQGESGNRPGYRPASSGRPDARPWQRPAPRGAQRPPRSSPPRRPDTPGPEAVPPHKRDQSPDRPPAPEQIVTKPKPPERG